MTTILDEVSTDVTSLDRVEVSLVSPTLAAVSLAGPLHTPVPVCVVLQDADGVPVSTAGLVLPGEQATVVNVGGRFDRCSVTRPDVTSPAQADILLHLFAWTAGVGSLDCPHPDLSCVLTLGGMWRWSTAVDAHVTAASLAPVRAGACNSGDWRV